MALTEKYTFDLDFDEERARLTKERQVQLAEKKRYEEEQEVEAAKQRYTPEQIEEIKTQAREEGKRTAMQEAATSQEKAMLDVLTQVLQKAQSLSEQEDAREKMCQRTGIETAFSLLKKISPSLTKGKELQDVNELIAQAFDENPNEQRLVIRVHDSVLDSVIKNVDKLAKENGFSGKPIVMADQALQSHDCRVEWADGGLERISNNLWDGLEKAVNHILVGLPTKPKKVAKQEEVKEDVEEKNQNKAEQEVTAETDNNDTTKKEEVDHE